MCRNDGRTEADVDVEPTEREAAPGVRGLDLEVLGLSGERRSVLPVRRQRGRQLGQQRRQVVEFIC